MYCFDIQELFWNHKAISIYLLQKFPKFKNKPNKNDRLNCSYLYHEMGWKTSIGHNAGHSSYQSELHAISAFPSGHLRLVFKTFQMVSHIAYGHMGALKAFLSPTMEKNFLDALRKTGIY